MVRFPNDSTLPNPAVRRLAPALVAAGLVAAVLVLGMSAAACGDGDGDGATLPPQGSVTPGPSGSPTSVVDLAEAPRVLTAYGANEGDFRSDQPGLTTGDFNGDGLADILAGARFADGPDGNRTDGGEAYIIFGAEEPPEEIDLGEGEADVTVVAAAAGDNLGIEVAAGDVNGDGTDDALIGASLALRPNYPNNKTGAVYILFGGADLGGVVDIAEDQQDVMIIGPRNLSHFGDSVATGDINGDGVQDVVVGAPFAEEIIGTGADAIYNTGAVYVVFGSPQLPGQVDLENGPPDAFLVGAGENDEMGDQVAAGDLNDDGIDDIVAVAEAADGPGDGRDGAGEVYVFYGSSTFGGVKHIAGGDEDVTLLGAESGDTLGFSMDVADVSGDGVADLVLGARLGSGPNNSRQAAGEAYVIFGGAPVETLDMAVGQPDVVVYGDGPGDFLGTSVGAAEFDGDGTAELFTSAEFASGGRADRVHAGAVYVFAPVRDGDLLDTAEGAQRLLVLGAAAGDRAGSSAAAGDMDGDGRPELVLIAQEAAGFDGAGPVGQVIVVKVP